MGGRLAGREGAGKQGGVGGMDAGGGLTVLVQEHIGIFAETAGIVPADVEVGEEDVLASAAVVGAVAGEDVRETVVRGLVGQEGKGWRYGRW